MRGHPLIKSSVNASVKHYRKSAVALIASLKKTGCDLPPELVENVFSFWGGPTEQPVAQEAPKRSCAIS